MLEVTDGDKVWFAWENSSKAKSVFQVDLALNPKEKFLFQRRINSTFSGDLERSVRAMC